MCCSCNLEVTKSLFKGEQLASFLFRMVIQLATVFRELLLDGLLNSKNCLVSYTAKINTLSYKKSLH